MKSKYWYKIIWFWEQLLQIDEFSWVWSCHSEKWIFCNLSPIFCYIWINCHTEKWMLHENMSRYVNNNKFRQTDFSKDCIIFVLTYCIAGNIGGAEIWQEFQIGRYSGTWLSKAAATNGSCCSWELPSIPKYYLAVSKFDTIKPNHQYIQN